MVDKRYMLHHKQKQESFLQLIETHKAIIHKVCNLYEDNASLRPDLFQEIVLQLWKNYEKYEGRSSFSTWMYRVALNTAISLYRKNTLRMPRVSNVIEMPEIADTGPPTEQQKQLEQLYKALRTLPELEKALVMLYMDDCTYKTMEAILGVKEATLRVKLNRAKEKLRQQFKEDRYEYR